MYNSGVYQGGVFQVCNSGVYQGGYPGVYIGVYIGWVSRSVHRPLGILRTVVKRGKRTSPGCKTVVKRGKRASLGM